MILYIVTNILAFILGVLFGLSFNTEDKKKLKKHFGILCEEDDRRRKFYQELYKKSNQVYECPGCDDIMYEENGKLKCECGYIIKSK